MAYINNLEDLHLGLIILFLVYNVDKLATVNCGCVLFYHIHSPLRLSVIPLQISPQT